MVPFYLKAFKDFSSSYVVYAVVFLPFETAVNVDLVILLTLHCNTDHFLSPTLKVSVLFEICLFVLSLFTLSNTYKVKIYSAIPVKHFGIPAYGIL